MIPKDLIIRHDMVMVQPDKFDDFYYGLVQWDEKSDAWTVWHFPYPMPYKEGSHRNYLIYKILDWENSRIIHELNGAETTLFSGWLYDFFHKNQKNIPKPIFHKNTELPINWVFPGSIILYDGKTWVVTNCFIWHGRHAWNILPDGKWAFPGPEYHEMMVDMETFGNGHLDRCHISVSKLKKDGRYAKLPDITSVDSSQ